MKKSSSNKMEKVDQADKVETLTKLPKIQKSFLVASVAAVTASGLNAHALHGRPMVLTSLTLRFSLSSVEDYHENAVSKFPNWTVDDTYKNLLKSYGVTTNPTSKIQIHQENSAVDLSCFDCVIKLLEYENVQARADNLGIGKGRV